MKSLAYWLKRSRINEITFYIEAGLMQRSLTKQKQA